MDVGLFRDRITFYQFVIILQMVMGVILIPSSGTMLVLFGVM